MVVGAKRTPNHNDGAGEEEGQATPSLPLLGLFVPPPPPPLPPLPHVPSDRPVDSDPLSEQPSPTLRITKYHNLEMKSSNGSEVKTPARTTLNDARASRTHQIHTNTPFALDRNDDSASNERTSLLPKPDIGADSYFHSTSHGADLFGTTTATPKTGARHREFPALDRLCLTGLPDLPAIEEVTPTSQQTPSDSFPKNHVINNLNPLFLLTLERRQQIKEALQYAASECASPSTWIGAFMFLLFSLVFSLTFGATITRPHGTTPLLGLVSRMSALGIMMGAPIYWLTLPDIPALYPTVDLFAAPFLAKIACVIDEVLFQDSSVSDDENDQTFLATFSFLASVSLLLSGSLTVLASVFEVVNLGAFLPFPVLCGFFTAAGCLTWTLAFKVDTNGLTVSQVFLSGDTNLMLMSLAHHAPSVAVAAIMKYMGPKHPLYVVMSVLCTIASFYVVMLIFGMSMDDMIEQKWFWSTNELHYRPSGEEVSARVKCFGAQWKRNRRLTSRSQILVSVWTTPSAFGWLRTLVGGNVHWGAVMKGLETAIALSFLYLLRCSLHSAALKKNVAMLSRVEKVKVEAVRPLHLSREFSDRIRNSSFHRRRFSETIDIESDNVEESKAPEPKATTIFMAKPAHSSLKQIMVQYGYSQFVCALVGGFGIVPCVAASPTMFMVCSRSVRVGALFSKSHAAYRTMYTARSRKTGSASGVRTFDICLLFHRLSIGRVHSQASVFKFACALLY
jgi:hypothetical protein